MVWSCAPTTSSLLGADLTYLLGCSTQVRHYSWGSRRPAASSGRAASDGQQPGGGISCIHLTKPLACHACPQHHPLCVRLAAAAKGFLEARAALLKWSAPLSKSPPPPACRRHLPVTCTSRQHLLGHFETAEAILSKWSVPLSQSPAMPLLLPPTPPSHLCWTGGSCWITLRQQRQSSQIGQRFSQNRCHAPACHRHHPLNLCRAGGTAGSL